MNKCRGSDEMGSDFTHLRARVPETTSPDEAYRAGGEAAMRMVENVRCVECGKELDPLGMRPPTFAFPNLEGGGHQMTRTDCAVEALRLANESTASAQEVVDRATAYLEFLSAAEANDG